MGATGRLLEHWLVLGFPSVPCGTRADCTMYFTPVLPVAPQYHVVPGRILTSQFVDGEEVDTLLDGAKLTLAINTGRGPKFVSAAAFSRLAAYVLCRIGRLGDPQFVSGHGVLHALAGHSSVPR